MLALLKNPAQLQRLRDEPELLDSAIDELLRYDSPVQFIIRVVMEDLAFKGREMRGGAEDYDPGGARRTAIRRFSRIRMRWTSGARRRATFRSGRGIHYCLGSPLALLEGGARRSAGLLERFPTSPAAGRAGVPESDCAARGGGVVGGEGARSEG